MALKVDGCLAQGIDRAPFLPRSDRKPNAAFAGNLDLEHRAPLSARALAGEFRPGYKAVAGLNRGCAAVHARASRHDESN